MNGGQDAGILPAIQELHRIYDAMAPLFGNALEGRPAPVILIQAAGRNLSVLGWMGPGFWADGDGETRRNEITITAENLARGAIKIASTMVHEMVHHVNELLGLKDCSASQYHNKRFKTMAESVGMVVERMGRRGWALTTPGEALAAQILALNISEEAFALFRNPGQRQKAPTKMKKWTCGCTTVRCATPLLAECQKCGKTFNPPLDFDGDDDDGEEG